MLIEKKINLKNLNLKRGKGGPTKVILGPGGAIFSIKEFLS
jgi:hypothetical protein